ncbi:MAG: VOC family protein [Patescibacteria group bacterium]
MAPQALNGLMLYVTDVANSLAHYEQLGFKIIQNQAPSFGSVMLNGFLIQFQDKRNPDDPDFVKEAMAEPKGGGLFVYLQVEDVDSYFDIVSKRGIVPTTQPRDWPTGNREFVIRDPDGYKFVFYQAHGAKSADHQHN